MTERDVRVIPELPAVGPLIARSAVAAPAKSRRPHPERVPDRTLLVLDHDQDLPRLAAYDRLCGFPLRDTVPATWLHVLTFPLQVALMAEADFPFALAGIVHVRNTMRLHRPVAATDGLRLTVRTRELRPHRRGTVFDIAAEVHVDDMPAWSGLSTYLARGRPAGTPAPQDEAAPAGSLGPASQQWRLPADLGRRYAAVSSDVNPLHLYPLTARPFGFRRPIVHGMWTHARALAAFGGRLPETYEVSVRFAKPILLPGRVGWAAEAGHDSADFAVVSSNSGKPYLIGHLAREFSG